MTHAENETDLGTDPDIALITGYLMGTLDVAEAEAVRLRMEEDEAFRALAQPLVAIWKVPPRWVRNPMPREQLERAWDEFTKRAGFQHQRRAARRRRWTIAGIVTGVLLAVAAVLYPFREQLALRYLLWTQFETARDSAGVVTLRDSSRFQLAPGATLQVHEGVARGDPQRMVYLTGAAGIYVAPLGGRVLTNIPPSDRFMVITKAGVLVTRHARFAVTMTGDTASVEVGVSGKVNAEGLPYDAADLPNYPYKVELVRPNIPNALAQGGVVSLREGERGRIYRNGNPSRLP